MHYSILKRMAACIGLLLLISCNNGGISNREDFIVQNNIGQGEQIPKDFTDDRWKELAGDYCFYTGDFSFGANRKCLFILGNKKEKQLLSFIELNNFLIPGKQGEGKYRTRFVTSYENLTHADYASANNLEAFNSLLLSIPELKDFKWKNEFQNRMMSSLIMYTQLRGMSFLGAPAVLEDSSLTKEQKLQKGFDANYEYNLRNFLRYNISTDLFQEIERLGFKVNPAVPHPFEKDKAYQSVLKDEFNLDDKSCLFIYYPFVSYAYIPADPAPQIVYFPAVNILQYKMRFTPDGFPQLERKNIYLSLLDGSTRK